MWSVIFPQLKKGAFSWFFRCNELPKLSSVPIPETQLRRKSLQVLRFSHDLRRLPGIHQKIEKVSQKKLFFFNFNSRIILLPLKYQFWAMAKLRQFSHFLQQINK